MIDPEGTDEAQRILQGEFALVDKMLVNLDSAEKAELAEYMVDAMQWHNAILLMQYIGDGISGDASEDILTDRIVGSDALASSHNILTVESSVFADCRSFHDA